MSGEIIKKKSYDLAFKLKAIENAEVEGNHAVANRLATYDDSTDSYEWENEQDSDAVLPSDD